MIPAGGPEEADVAEADLTKRDHVDHGEGPCPRRSRARSLTLAGQRAAAPTRSTSSGSNGRTAKRVRVGAVNFLGYDRNERTAEELEKRVRS
jgi:hypothetical protein